MSYNNILKKVEYPPYGFILQKDVYTTNLLYAYDQFPLTSLRKSIPFRHHKKENPNKSVIIVRQNGCISDNAKSKHSFYLVNTFKPKYLFKKKLLFPIPKSKSIPLTYMNLYEEISKKDIKVKNIDDDLNITSNNGRKILYKFKENNSNNNNKKILPSISGNNLHEYKKISEKDKSLAKISLRNKVNQLNDELRSIKQIELDRRRSFIKDKFFSTQIYINKIIEKYN